MWVKLAISGNGKVTDPLITPQVNLDTAIAEQVQFRFLIPRVSNCFFLGRLILR